MPKYRYKEFNPKRGEPGASIVWEHYHWTGDIREVSMTTRIGIVWSKAPERGVWVTPDAPLESDLYGLIYVAVPPVNRGVPHSSDKPNTGPGWYTANAALAAVNTRLDNARRAS